jgi:hypothetical protein
MTEMQCQDGEEAKNDEIEELKSNRDRKTKQGK